MTARFEHDAHLPRHAFTALDRARAGDVWRAFQETAVLASTACGWPPRRYRAEGTAFVMRSMTVVHHAEALYGEPLRGQTWIRRMRRGMLSTREVRLLRPAEGSAVQGNGAQGNAAQEIAAGTQEWVHVDASMRPARAPASLVEAFPVVAEGAEAQLPEWASAEGPEHVFEFPIWYTWMDPLNHVNHPVYVDFADEVIATRCARAGLDPLRLRPHAESVTFFRGLEAGRNARVRSQLIGTTTMTAQGRDALVTRHLIEDEGGTTMATATLIRSHPDPAFVSVWKG